MRAPSKPPLDRTKEQIRADIRADLKTYFPERPRAYAVVEEGFGHWVWQLQQRPWTSETILEARSNPFFLDHEQLGQEWVTMYFGRTRPRRPWLIAARILAYQLSDGLPHRRRGKPVRRKGFGSEDGPFMRLLYAQLVRLLGAEAVPTQEAVWLALKRAA
jgi:hypothetical protein